MRPHDGSWLIAGWYLGDRRQPQWVGNLREVTGAERAEVWQVMLRTWPNFARHEERTDRVIAVFQLTRRR